MDASSLPYELSKESLQKIAVSLIKIALMNNFDMAYHQKEFLRCLAYVHFGRDLIGKYKTFSKIYCFTI